MRILQINSVYGYGSTGRIVENLHHAIIQSGHESYVIYGRGKTNDDPNVYKIGNAIEQGIDLLATRLFNRHGQTNFFATQKMIKKIEEIKPDIVHLHNLHGYYVNYIKLLEYLKKSKIKVVWLLHDPWIISGSSADEGGLNYDWEGVPSLIKLVNISREYPKHSKWSSKQSLKNYALKKRLLGDTDIQFITPSKWLADIMGKSYLKGSKIDVIHNGIDLKQFRYLGKEYRTKTIQILGVASVWERRKGLKYFNQLAEDLGDKYSITLLGITPAQKKDIHPSIICIERTESIEELVQLYNKADIFVNPTLFDNFPTVNLEAQACGTPVVTFDTGGSGESVTSKTGKLAKRENYTQLLNYVMSFSKKNDETILNCIENAKEYSKELMMSNYLSEYIKITN